MRFVWTICLLVWLSGCQPLTTEDALTRYLERLNRALELPTEPADLEIRTLAAWPPASMSQLPLTEIRLGVFETYALRSCPDLLSLIAQRNNQLGRVMPLALRLEYELELSQRLHVCYRQAIQMEQEDLAEQLRPLIEQVDQRLPAIFWNFLVASEEMRGLMRLSRGPLPLAAQPLEQEAQALLETLLTLQQELSLDQQWRHTEEQVTLLHLGPYLQPLQDQASVGQLLQSLILAEATLKAAQRQLDARLTGPPLCPQPTPSLPRAQTSQRVLLQTFIGEIQPWMAQLERQSHIWLPALNQLLDQPDAPEVIQAWRQNWIDPAEPATPWRRFQQAHREHARLWEALLHQCGLRVGLEVVQTD
ncbi:DUF3080 family protein [Marinospirillum sp. MEB164]|uniref:DUF3080 family protein n=1 Tax=Marinospirillum alkalitolerans TaxID=3123374 RepID=A0ABW8PY62_9GAMM